MKSLLKTNISALVALGLSTGIAMADQVILDDLIVDGSACIGLDCVNNESFGFDTLRLKENNLRVNFSDTSSSASFPNNDWRIVINDSTNGGDNYFGIEDASAGRIPFRVEAGAPVNSLYVEADGDVGIKTREPVVDLHIVEGNTPTVRLAQDGSDGFAPQVWDLAGNETNFFIRDVTHSSNLPFRIRPGASTDSLFIQDNGNVGIGTSGPEEKLHVVGTGSGANTDIRIEAVNSNGTGSGVWEFAVRGVDGEFAINDEGTAGAEFIFRGANAVLPEVPGLDVTGTVTASVGFTVGATALAVPDYVFGDDYDLMPLEELDAFITANSHLPNIPSEQEIKSKGALDMTQMQMALLEKIEELTLYTLEQQKVISDLQQKVEALQD